MSRRSRLFPTLVAAVALALTLAGCSSGGGASAATSAGGAACVVSTTTGQVAVSIKGFAFNPAQVTATVGQTITFTNNDTTDHTATITGGACTTGHIAAGAAQSLTFSKAGSYPFACAIHPSMTGTITVS